MNTMRKIILPAVMVLFGVHCAEGMMEVARPHEDSDRELSSRGHRRSRRDFRAGQERGACQERRERARADELEDEMIHLRSNDGALVTVSKEVATRLSLTLGIMNDVSQAQDIIDVNVPGNELREIVRLVSEQHNLLQVGMEPKNVVEIQRAELPVTRLRSRDVVRTLFHGLPQAADYLGCDFVRRALGDANEENLFDYFVSGILPLRLIGMTPQTLNLRTIFEETAGLRATTHIAIRALSDPGLCCFYHKLPDGKLKLKIQSIIFRSALRYAGNLGAMPVQLAATSCLLRLPHYELVLQVFGIDERWFGACVIPAIESGVLNASFYPGGMNARQLGFVIECARLLQVTKLNLSYNGIDALPPEIGQLHETLTDLDVCVNRLTALPREIWQLRALTNLNVFYNQLVALSGEIGQLQALTHLNVARNQLAVLPVEIWQLRALTDLNLGDNLLAVLPGEIGQLQALINLTLYGNFLVTLPVEIGMLRFLTDLNVCRNFVLAALPVEIGQHNRDNLSVFIRGSLYANALGREEVIFPGHPEE